jgi:hypothetical protein
MITPLLERAIGQGKAYYKKITHAMGGFSSVPVPDGKTIIIVDITWNQFFNPYKNDRDVTLRENLKFSEYQMIVDGKKSRSVFTYRNTTLNNGLSVDLGGFSIALPTYQWIPYFTFYPSPPIKSDVFLICEQYIDITITRNAYLKTLTPTYNKLQPAANQRQPPTGLGYGVTGINTLLTLKMDSETPNTMYYTPPNLAGAGASIPAGGRTAINYEIDIDPLSQIYPPGVGFNLEINMPAFTQPLVELGVVIINSNDFDKLMNS